MNYRWMPWAWTGFLMIVLSTKGLGQILPVDSLRADSSVFFHSVPYALQESDSLWLDYYPSDKPAQRPTLLFVHGGGFFTGTYRNESIVSYCDSLRKWGYPVASMQYELHLKGQDFHCDQPTPNKVRAVEVCVRDIHRAAHYLSSPLDSTIAAANGIVLIGSSAGAEAALHAAYWSKDRPFFEGIEFPADSVGYRGVIAFAGALENLDLITPENVVPTAMYHGSCDPLVPLESDIHHYCPKRTPGAWMLHGSASIADRLDALDASYYLHVTCGAGHSMAGRPMVENVAETLLFIQTAVEKGAWQQTRIVLQEDGECDDVPAYAPCGK